MFCCGVIAVPQHHQQVLGKSPHVNVHSPHWRSISSFSWDLKILSRTGKRQGVKAGQFSLARSRIRVVISARGRPKNSPPLPSSQSRRAVGTCAPQKWQEAHPLTTWAALDCRRMHHARGSREPSMQHM